MWNTMLYSESEFTSKTNYEYFGFFYGENTYDKKYYLVEKNGTSFFKLQKVLKKNYEKCNELNVDTGIYFSILSEHIYRHTSTQFNIIINAENMIKKFQKSYTYNYLQNKNKK